MFLLHQLVRRPSLDASSGLRVMLRYKEFTPARREALRRESVFEKNQAWPERIPLLLAYTDFRRESIFQNLEGAGKVVPFCYQGP